MQAYDTLTEIIADLPASVQAAVERRRREQAFIEAAVELFDLFITGHAKIVIDPEHSLQLRQREQEVNKARAALQGDGAGQEGA